MDRRAFLATTGALLAGGVVTGWLTPLASCAGESAPTLYWQFDDGTATWRLTPDAGREAGRLADLDGSGTFRLVPLRDLPAGARVAWVGQRDRGVAVGSK